jgi:hypothetical protein
MQKMLSMVVILGNGSLFPRKSQMASLHWRDRVGSCLQNPRTQLAVCLMLLTVGMALFLVGIDWLVYLGIILLLVAGKFTSSLNKIDSWWTVAVIVAGVAIFAIDRLSIYGLDYVRTPRSPWEWSFFSVLWFACCIREYWYWRMKNQIQSRNGPINP